MFLIRAAFWLSVVVLFIPGDPASGTNAPRVGLMDAVVAASGAIADMSGMCERRPEVCVTGGAALQVFGEKAKNGAKMLYGAIGNGSSSETAAPIQPAAGTLTPSDLEPDWRAPANGAV